MYKQRQIEWWQIIIVSYKFFKVVFSLPGWEISDIFKSLILHGKLKFQGLIVKGDSYIYVYSSPFLCLRAPNTKVIHRNKPKFKWESRTKKRYMISLPVSVSLQINSSRDTRYYWRCKEQALQRLPFSAC